MAVSGELTVRVVLTTISLVVLDGRLIYSLAGHSNSVYALAVLQNGYLATGGFDKTIKIWNTDTGGLIRTLTGHRLDIFVCGFAKRVLKF